MDLASNEMGLVSIDIAIDHGSIDIAIPWITLTRLFNLAYFGQTAQSPILEPP
jgi:hypothetical protein